MITESQKEKLRELLIMMQSSDLFSLANTVTNYLVTPVSNEDAIDNILLYSKSISEVLNRKKITKEIVFKYLHNKRVTGVSPLLNKKPLIDLLLSHWGEDINNQIEEIRNDSQESTTSSNDSPLVEEPKNETQNMAELFVQWFYTLINMGQSDDGQKFGPDHFWGDCNLQIALENQGLNIREERSTGPESALLLAQLRSEFNIVFNPNLSSEGVRGMSEPHGAVVIMACGTVHQGETCAGLFEQKFLLLRDPMMQNNWRIKRSQMYLKTSGNKLTQSTPLPMINN